MYDITRGVFPLKWLDLINPKYVQNAKIYAANLELGFHPINTKSSTFRGKPSCLKMGKQSASLEGGVCLNQSAWSLGAAFSWPYTHAFCIFHHRNSFTENNFRIWEHAKMPALPWNVAKSAVDTVSWYTIIKNSRKVRKTKIFNLAVLRYHTNIHRHPWYAIHAKWLISRPHC